MRRPFCCFDNDEVDADTDDNDGADHDDDGGGARDAGGDEEPDAFACNLAGCSSNHSCTSRSDSTSDSD